MDSTVGEKGKTRMQCNAEHSKDEKLTSHHFGVSHTNFSAPFFSLGSKDKATRGMISHELSAPSRGIKVFLTPRAVPLIVR
jgi:hypothetical protein